MPEGGRRQRRASMATIDTTAARLGDPGIGAGCSQEARLPRTKDKAFTRSSHLPSRSRSGSTQAACCHAGASGSLFPAWERIARHMASAAKADRNQSSQKVPGQHRAVRHQGQRHPRRQAPGHQVGYTAEPPGQLYEGERAWADARSHASWP
jgi:hypothetical protein